MQNGNPGQDPVCGRCKQKIEMAVRTEAVYQDGIWFHTACHRAGADPLASAPGGTQTWATGPGGDSYTPSTPGADGPPDGV
jgi:hypothetical protein